MKTNVENTIERNVPEKVKGSNKRPERSRTSGVEKLEEIGKKYERVPHPTIRNTFILREKK